MNQEQLRRLIKETLKEVDEFIPYSENAVELLMLTAAAESNLGEYIYQLNGPARGIFQMEPRTEMDLWDYMSTRRVDIGTWMQHRFPNGDGLLTGDLRYQILMARIFYWRFPERLPSGTNAYSMAFYWKKYYNTFEGKGNISKAVEKYRRYAI